MVPTTAYKTLVVVEKHEGKSSLTISAKRAKKRSPRRLSSPGPQASSEADYVTERFEYRLQLGRIALNWHASVGVRAASAVDSDGITIWIANPHCDDGKRFVVCADEMLTAFLE